jgi:hypothetical protein
MNKNKGDSEKSMTRLESQQNTENYTFSWGHITEKKTGEYVIWEYSANELLANYHAAGKRTSDLQRQVFHLLEQKVEYTTRDISVLLNIRNGWKLIPSNNTKSIFYQVSHFSHEEAAKKWAMNHLFIGIVPDIVKTLMHHATSIHRH